MAGDDVNKKGEAVAASKIYPLAASMSANGLKADVQIVKLEPQGFIGYVRTGVVHVGIHYTCDITLPSGFAPLQVPGQVFKTYDHINPNNGRVDRVTEVLFTKISEEDKAKIRSVLKAGTPGA